MDRSIIAYVTVAAALTALIAVYISPYLPLDALILGLLGLWVASYAIGALEPPHTSYRRRPVVKSRILTYATVTGSRDGAVKGWLAENPFEESLFVRMGASPTSGVQAAELKSGAGED